MLTSLSVAPSIIITCFNREKFVARCIRSALSQRVVDRDQFEVIVIDDFSDGPERRWQFYTDQVMGGVSEGGASVQFGSEGPYVRLEGSVSTANNGGFIFCHHVFYDN